MEGDGYSDEKYCVCPLVAAGEAKFTTNNSGDLFGYVKTWLMGSGHKLDNDYLDSASLLSALYGKSCSRHKCLNKDPSNSMRSRAGRAVESSYPMGDQDSLGAFFPPRPLSPPTSVSPPLLHLSPLPRTPPSPPPLRIFPFFFLV